MMLMLSFPIVWVVWAAILVTSIIAHIVLLIYFSKVAIKYYIRKPARLGTIYSEIYSIPFLVTEVVRRHRMDPSIFPTMLSGERWSKQVSTTVALTVQTLYGEVFSAITWYSMAWHGVVGTLTDQTLYGEGVQIFVVQANLLWTWVSNALALLLKIRCFRILIRHIVWLLQMVHHWNALKAF